MKARLLRTFEEKPYTDGADSLNWTGTGNWRFGGKLAARFSGFTPVLEALAGRLCQLAASKSVLLSSERRGYNDPVFHPSTGTTKEF
jgi:hypothetical protein